LPGLDNSSPLLVELHSYWAAKRGELFAPSRRDIDPVEIPKLLPHLMLVEVMDGGARFRYRLAGTEIERRVGCHMTGRYVDELTTGRYGAYIHGLYQTLLTTRRPIYSESAYGQIEDAPLVAQRLMLPLSSDGRTIDKVLCGQIVSYSKTGTSNTLMAAQDKFLEVCARQVEPVA
jgi:hypothetical protein